MDNIVIDIPEKERFCVRKTQNVYLSDPRGGDGGAADNTTASTEATTPEETTVDIYADLPEGDFGGKEFRARYGDDGRACDDRGTECGAGRERGE